ncbi:MAG: hypothetical protein ACI88G_002293, partial [Woeseiaceae bacterium]
GLFLLSMVAPRYHVTAVGRSVLFSIFVVLLINKPELMNPILGTAYEGPLLAWPWLFPVGTLCCFAAAFRGKRETATT